MRNLAVYASELVPNTGQQLTLFTDPQRQIKAERLNGVIDEIHRRFGFLSYKAWLRITCLASFLTANVGLNQIIAWSTPVLMFLYPLAMALIFLSILSPLFHKSSVVYVWVVVFTVVPAVFDMVAAFPAVVSQSTFGQAMAHAQSFLPLASSGMDWLVPALVGAVFGTAHYLLLQRAKASTGMEVPMKR